MADHAGEAPAVALLPDDIVDRIIIRLPAAHIARCRAVCRRWRDLTTHHHFQVAHHDYHSRRPPKPLVHYRPIFPSGLAGNLMSYGFDVRLDAIDVSARSSRPLVYFPDIIQANLVEAPPLFEVEGSCDGILLASYDDQLYAYNPCSRRFARLPPLHHLRGDLSRGVYGGEGGGVLGFYRLPPPPPGDGHALYRVLYLSGGPPECLYWVYTLTLGATDDRCIGRPSQDEAMGQVLARGISPGRHCPPAVVNDSLHWLPDELQNNNMIIVFDAAAEIFHWIGPPLVDAQEIKANQLLDMGGKLALAAVHDDLTHMDVWVMQRYDVKDWVWQYRIVLPMAEIGRLRVQAARPLVYVLSQGRHAFVEFPDVLFLCDATGTAVACYQLPHYRAVATQHTVIESFILHPFLPLQKSDALPWDPPFFQEE